MPEGAVANPIKVPGGLMIITLQAKREIGRDVGTVVTLRQIFLAFSSPLNPQEPDRTAASDAGQGARDQHGCA